MKNLKLLFVSLVFWIGAGIFPVSANAAEWTKMESGTTVPLEGVWAGSGSEVFSVGENGVILNYDGTAWRTMNSGTNFALEGVWGKSGQDVFATGGDINLIGGGIILHYDGNSWTNITPTHMSSLTFIGGAWGPSGSADVYFSVADASSLFSITGVIWHYNGSSWQTVVGKERGFAALESISGTSGANIFASGDKGTILHYNGSSWTPMSSGTSNWLSRIWCTGSKVFAVGQNGTIVHYDGSSWKTMNSGTASDLKGIWGRNESDVFASGKNGTILRYNGSAWQPMNTGVSGDLHTVWGTDTEIFAVGAGGTILHYSEGNSLLPTPPTLKTCDPAINTWSSDNTLEITWNPGQDENGVAGYSYLLNTAALADPDSTVETADTRFVSSSLADGKNHYFHIRTVNSSGAVSPVMHLGPFYIDTVPPQNGSVLINSGDAKTFSPEITLTLSAADSLSGVSKMAFSNDGLYWSAPMTYAGNADWTLISGEGTRTVYARFSDSAGNQTTAEITDEIVIDANSPGRLVLLAGGGAAKSNTLWNTTQELATTAYRIFSLRGFRDTDIYFMCPVTWIDFNGNGENDHVTDVPPENESRNLTKEDVRYAITDWAVKNHKSGTPLFVWLIDHGYPDYGEPGPCFMISPGELLYAAELNQMLSTYENMTGGQVIVVSEFCYSGQFLGYLKKNGRIIVSSASDRVVNYDNMGTNSFSNIFLHKLFENSSIKDAFSKTAQTLVKFPLTWNQSPQMDDNGDGKYDTGDGLLAATVRVGADFTMGAPLPEITDIVSGSLNGTAVSFTVTANAHMKRVWGTVQEPGYVPGTGGDYPLIDLEKFELSDLDISDGKPIYDGNYSGFTKSGKYILTFYAKDQFGNTALSDPVEIRTGTEPGDMDDSGSVNLADAVLVLKIISGLHSAQTLNADAGAVSDGRIGLEDAVFVLRKVAGL